MQFPVNINFFRPSPSSFVSLPFVLGYCLSTVYSGSTTVFSGHLLSLQSYRSAFLPRFFFCPVVLSCINGRIMCFLAISFSSSSSKGIFRLPASVILFRLKNVVIVVIRNSRWATSSYLLLSCILNYVFFLKIHLLYLTEGYTLAEA